MLTLDLRALAGARAAQAATLSNCLEVAVTFGAVAVRDSKHPTGSVLTVPSPAWTTFTTALRDGELGP